MNELHQMIGRVFTSVDGQTNGDCLAFRSEDAEFIFEHKQDCCEFVRIVDICGDLADLVGSPVVLAEETTNEEEDSNDWGDRHKTWTFYRFGTVKGTVTVRWLGESNGYYSEGVHLTVTYDSKKGDSERGRNNSTG